MNDFQGKSSSLQPGCDGLPAIEMKELWFPDELESYEHHQCMRQCDLSDRYTFTQQYATLPPNLTVNIRQVFANLHSDKILNGYLSEKMVLGCSDAVAQGLAWGIDFLDSSESCIESILEEFMTEAAESGYLPPDEEGLYVALRDKLWKFCLQMRAAFLALDLPVIEFIGMPYQCVGFSAGGTLVWKLKNIEEISKIIFE